MIFFPQHFNSEMASTQEYPSMLLSLDLLVLLLVLLSSALNVNRCAAAAAAAIWVVCIHRIQFNSLWFDMPIFGIMDCLALQRISNFKIVQIQNADNYFLSIFLHAVRLSSVRVADFPADTNTNHTKPNHHRTIIIIHKPKAKAQYNKIIIIITQRLLIYNIVISRSSK